MYTRKDIIDSQEMQQQAAMQPTSEGYYYHLAALKTRKALENARQNAAAATVTDSDYYVAGHVAYESAEGQRAKLEAEKAEQHLVELEQLAVVQTECDQIKINVQDWCDLINQLGFSLANQRARR